MLALFVPLIISSGGNSGSQASTLVIRALALGELTLRDWWRVIRREFAAGLALGEHPRHDRVPAHHRVVRVLRPATAPHWLLVAVTVALALVGIVLCGARWSGRCCR